MSLTAGALGSVFQPGFSAIGGPGEAPNRIYGAGAYADVRFSRWVQFEGEGRWMHLNTLYGVNEDTYLAGPRIPLHTFHFLRATPYAKALVGLGYGKFLTNPALTVAYGGGVDLRLTKKISIRAGDFEYQQWRVTPTTLWPYGVSVGIGYKIF